MIYRAAVEPRSCTLLNRPSHAAPQGARPVRGNIPQALLKFASAGRECVIITAGRSRSNPARAARWNSAR